MEKKLSSIFNQPLPLPIYSLKSNGSNTEFPNICGYVNEYGTFVTLDEFNYLYKLNGLFLEYHGTIDPLKEYLRITKIEIIETNISLGKFAHQRKLCFV